MRKLNTREKVMLGALAVAALAAWWGMGEGGMGFGGPGPESRALAALPGDPPQVRVDLLALDPVDFDPNGRNLFAYYTPPPPKRERPQPKPLPPPPPPPPPPKRTVAKKTEERREPKPPEPKFDYIGYLGPKDDRIAVFTAEDRMFVARVGEVVEEQFELEEFRYGTVIFSFTDQRFKGQTTELKLYEDE